MIRSEKQRKWMEKLHQWNKGRIPWNKNKKTGVVPKSAFKKGQNIGNQFAKGNPSNKTSFKKRMVPWNKGKYFSEITKKKMSKAKEGKYRGKNHPNWKGGITVLSERIRRLSKYREWGKKIFQRDNYTCQYCGQRGGKLEVHHQEPFHRIFTINNIKTIEDAINCKEFWNISNGFTLCEKCHNETKKDERLKWKVPFVNFPKNYLSIKEEIDTAIHRILSKGEFILGKEGKEFEKNLANFIGVKYAISAASGTDALFLSLKAAGIGQGDEVIAVSHTFVASISAIVHCGAKPILVDVREDFLMNPDKIEEKITKRTKAIIPVYLNGRVCEMDKIMKIAKRYNLMVIEDAAQALGAKYRGKMAGTFGITGTFSFYPAKILGAFGDGGAVLTNNKKIAEKIRLFRDHGQKSKTEIVCFGWNSRLDNLQAAILNVKFKYLPEWIERRREIAKIYNRGLFDIPEVKLPPSPNSDEKHFDIYQNYVIRAQKRDKLREFLIKKEIETLIKDPIPNHFQPALAHLGVSLPFTEKLAKEVISLPIYPELTNEQIEYVINCIKKFYVR